jgi:hypothetical protein
MRGAGIDGIFDTGDDRIVPLVVSFGGSNALEYRIGTNRLSFAVAGTMPTDTYRLSLKPSATDPFGQPVDGNGDGTGGDAYARTFTYAAPSNRYVVTVDPGEVVADVDFGNHDVVTPKVLSASFAFATAQRIVAQFNDDVSASLSLADLTLLNATTNTPVDLSGFTLSWDGATNTATIDVNGILADANYRATFSAAGIADPSGNALDGDGNGTGGDDFAMTFFFLNGDANHDRVVNLSDFNILAANFGQGGRNFTQGDFNYDGTVNLGDFNILASRFGQTLGESDDDALLG